MLKQDNGSEQEKQALSHKEDWPEAKERYRAWWAHENHGRCGLWVTAPRDDATSEPEPPAPDGAEEKWTDLEYWVRFKTWRNRRTFHGGESFPVWSSGYPGREGLPVFLGCPIQLGRETGWVDPILTGGGLDACGLRLDPGNRWWKLAIRSLELGVERFRGQAVLSVGAFGGSGDTLAALRGTERLLFDLVERPDEVRAADMHLMALWIEVYSRFHAIASRAGEGSTCWFGLWAPGKFYACQNDFSFNIGTEMFQEAFLPTIARQTEFLDYSVYHLDGVDAFRHLDALLELPRLQAIQVLPGAGKPSPLRYMDILNRVQSAGRNLHISLACNEVEAALSELSARGLFIETRCATETDARDLLRNAQRWSHDRAGRAKAPAH